MGQKWDLKIRERRTFLQLSRGDKRAFLELGGWERMENYAKWDRETKWMWFGLELNQRVGLVGKGRVRGPEFS